MDTTPHSTQAAARRFLWGSAVVLGALVLLQAWRTGEARAEMVAPTPGGLYISLTAATGSEEMLLVLDSRSEAVAVYKTVNQNSIELFRRYELPRLFGEAQARATGRK